MSPPDAEDMALRAPAVGLPVAAAPGFWRRAAAFFGPGYLVAVGYMDPGNWATGIAGGSAFGYSLLSVVLFSSLAAVVLQMLSLRLGIASGRDLAQSCRDAYGPVAAVGLWVLCQAAIVACDLAELIGTAIALQLLFGLPLAWGIVLTGLNVMLLLTLPQNGSRYLVGVVCMLMSVVVSCFAAELWLSRPDPAAVAAGLLPSAEVVARADMLYLAVGIIGATVMPHNLYLHSAVVRLRPIGVGGRGDAIRLATIDGVTALTLAFFVNAGIVMLAASTFHAQGRTEVADFAQSYRLLSPILGTSLASVLFAVALLAAGLNSAVTVTLAGQVTGEGFLGDRWPSRLGRVLARALAVVPAVVITMLMGEAATARLMVLSQVVLSLQLPFAVLPLIHFTSDRQRMGEFVNPAWLKGLALALALLVVGLNVLLVAGL